MNATPKTVGEVLKSGAEYLAGKGVDESRMAVELLLARLLRCRRLDLPLKAGVELGEKHLEAMRRGLRRAADHEPIQYILGEWDFMGHTFKTDKRALIPRPETEALVEKILDCKPVWAGEGKPGIVDIGTGSGCIVISLALARPDAAYLGLDVSEDALALARENAAKFGLTEKVIFASAELCDLVEPASIDLIVANLPYIPTAEYERLPRHIREHEPRSALDGGAGGLDIVEPVVQDASMALKPGGWLFLEIGCDQAAVVSAMLTDNGFEAVGVSQDLAGRDRIVSGVMPKA